MKLYLIFILILISKLTLAQIPNEYPLREKRSNVSKILDKSLSKWKTEYSFDNLGFLVETKSYYKNNLRGHTKFNYSLQDSVLTLVTSNEKDEILTEKYYFKSDLTTLNSLVCFSANETLPMKDCDSFNYKEGRLIAYKFIMGGLNNKSGWIKFEYDSLGRLKHIDDGQSESERTFYYDDKNNLTEEVVRSYDKQNCFVGVATWSETDPNIYHIVYEDFDKYGNWRKKYFLTSTKKLLDSKRKIIYKS